MAAHVDVRVAEELRGDVGAVVGLGGGGQVGIAVPLPAGAVGVAGGGGGVLHPGGGDDAHRLALVGDRAGGGASGWRRALFPPHSADWSDYLSFKIRAEKHNVNSL